MSCVHANQCCIEWLIDPSCVKCKGTRMNQVFNEDLLEILWGYMCMGLGT